MPSTGMRSVAAVLKRAVAGSSLSAGSGLPKLSARSRVEKLLTTWSSGVFSAAPHSAATIEAPYLPSLARCAVPLPDQELPSGFW